MSLLHRVSSFDSFGPERGRQGSTVSLSGASGRKLSYSPVPGSWQTPTVHEEALKTIGAFEVSKTRRIGKIEF